MNEHKQEIFKFHHYPNDLDPLEAWLKARGATDYTQIEDPEFGTLVIAVGNKRERVGTILVPHYIMKDLHYEQINHIFQRILWTLKHGH